MVVYVFASEKNDDRVANFDTQDRWGLYWNLTPQQCLPQEMWLLPISIYWLTIALAKFAPFLDIVHHLITFSHHKMARFIFANCTWPHDYFQEWSLLQTHRSCQLPPWHYDLDVSGFTHKLAIFWTLEIILSHVWALFCAYRLPHLCMQIIFIVAILWKIWNTFVHENIFGTQL